MTAFEKEATRKKEERDVEWQLLTLADRNQIDLLRPRTRHPVVHSAVTVHGVPCSFEDLRDRVAPHPSQPYCPE